MRATELLEKYKTADPCGLCVAMNVAVFYKPLPEHAHGIYIRGVNQPSIIINCDGSNSRKVLTLCYLLGVHAYEIDDVYTLDDYEKIEVEPAAFAYVVLSKLRGFGPERDYLKDGEPPRFISALHRAWSVKLGSNISPLLFGSLRPDGHVLYVSESHKHWIGRDPKEIVGSNPFLLIHPDDRPYVMAKFSKLVAEKTPKAVSYRYIRSDGGQLPVRAVGTPILNEQGEVEEVIITGKVFSALTEHHGIFLSGA